MTRADFLALSTDQLIETRTVMLQIFAAHPDVHVSADLPDRISDEIEHATAPRCTDPLPRHRTASLPQLKEPLVTSQYPITPERLAEIRKHLDAPGAAACELYKIAVQLFASSNYWYKCADYWRESYRIAKGLTGDELNARIAMQEVMRLHAQPCRFLNSPDCTCDASGSDDQPNPPYDMPATIDNWQDL